jgi:hypothetical protein
VRRRATATPCAVHEGCIFWLTPAGRPAGQLGVAHRPRAVAPERGHDQRVGDPVEELATGGSRPGTSRDPPTPVPVASGSQPVRTGVPRVSASRSSTSRHARGACAG